MMITTSPSRTQWLTDLIRLEIALWERIDRRLREKHGLSLAFFEALYSIAQAPDHRLRVGDLARALRITVGGTSKLVDRIEAAGLIRREPAADDRRVSQLILTELGQLKFAAASQTCEAETAAALDAALSPDEQRLLHQLIGRVLIAAASDDPPSLARRGRSSGSLPSNC